MKIFAHRGVTGHHPGNSLPAIERALDEGYSVEIDVRSTADGTLILCHDQHVPSTDGRLIDVTRTELQDLYDLAETGPYGESAYPRLEDVLSLFSMAHTQDAELAIHVKDDKDGLEIALRDLAASVENRIEESCLLESIFVFDVSIDSAQRFAEIAPRMRVGLSVGEAEFISEGRHPTVYSYDQVRSVQFDIVWADEWLGSLYSESLVARCHADDRSIICVSPELHRHTTPMHPGAHNYASRWPTIASMGVDGICTDYPDQFRQLEND
jgi:glycerophosphoryl diester phosphodiesterase